jgi:hypothetical protein
MTSWMTASFLLRTFLLLAVPLPSGINCIPPNL